MIEPCFNCKPNKPQECRIEIYLAKKPSEKLLTRLWGTSFVPYADEERHTYATYLKDDNSRSFVTHSCMNVSGGSHTTFPRISELDFLFELDTERTNIKAMARVLDILRKYYDSGQICRNIPLFVSSGVICDIAKALGEKSAHPLVTAVNTNKKVFVVFVKLYEKANDASEEGK